MTKLHAVDPDISEFIADGGLADLSLDVLVDDRG